ncbi:MAG TPA: hypothetical protein VMZ50_10730 [Phycisphaerae bacterium]|nr:hypothetical protein [Phycisphaerae bacterium]
MARKRRWVRRLAWALVIVVVLVVVLSVAAKYWIIPAVVKWQVRAQLADYWDGEASLADVEFNYSGLIHLGGFSLKDRSGREWLHVGSVTITLRDFPGTHPVLTGVEVRDVRAAGHVVDGKIAPPLKPFPEGESNIGEYIDLQNVSVKPVTITIAGEGREYVFDDVAFSLRQDSGRYAVSLTRRKEGKSEILDCSGTIDAKTLEANLNVVLKHKLDAAEVKDVLAALGQGDTITAECDLAVNLSARGNLNEPARIRPEGTIRVENGKASTPHGEAVRNLELAAILSGGDEISLKSETLRAEVCGGTIVGRFALAVSPNPGAPSVRYSAHLAANNVSVPQAAFVASGKKELTSGTLQASLQVHGEGTDLGGLRGEGIVFIANADLHVMELGRQLFRTAGADPDKIDGGNSVDSAFRMQGLRAIFDKLQVGNNIMALAVEKGGWVDASTQNVDLFVVAAPLGDILSKIPGVSLVSNLTKKLTGVRVRGNLNDPPEKLIRKEPVKDIAEGTMSFFRDLSAGGGKIGSGAANTLKGLFQALEKKGD